MALVAVQMGHVNGRGGATHEEEIIKLITPYVMARVASSGHTAKLYDASIEREDDNNQYKADVAIFLHCDADGPSATGYSIGYWEEEHPGSVVLASVLKQVYGVASGLRWGGFNITKAEWHYYANTRFQHSCKCVLLEMGYVSNPRELEFLRNYAAKLGYAIADAIVQYLGGKPPKIWEEDLMYKESEGSRMDCLDIWQDRYNYWLHIANDTTQEVEVKLSFTAHSNDQPIAANPFRVKPGKSWHQDLVNIVKGYGIKGSFRVQFTSSGPVTWSIREFQK